MLAHPTDSALPPFFIGTEILQPTMIIARSTVHLIFPHDDAGADVVAEITRYSQPSHSYLLLEIDEPSEQWIAVSWRSVYFDVTDEPHQLNVALAANAIRYAEPNDYGYCENSVSEWGEHELAEAELDRFGLAGGTLTIGGTRTLRVWRAHPAAGAAALSVTCIHEQTGLHCYSWRTSLVDRVNALFPEMEGDDSIAAW